MKLINAYYRPTAKVGYIVVCQFLFLEVDTSY